MTPLSAFFLGVALMALTNFFLLWAGWSWLTDPKNVPQLLLGMFSTLARRSLGLRVLDAQGDEREVRWDDLECSVERAGRHLREGLGGAPFL